MAYSTSLDQSQAESIVDEYSYMHPTVAKLLRRVRIPQHSNEWNVKRQVSITATNFAPILGQSKWEKPAQIFKRKTKQINPVMRNDAMNHGIYYEPEAKHVFELVTGIQLYSGDIGLVMHEEIEWVGASPDAVAVHYPFIIEIKCPAYGLIHHECPAHYYAQVQCQLAVCNIDVCYIVQYDPPNFPVSKGLIDIKRVDRDPAWFTSVLPEISAFYTRVLKFYEDSGNSISNQTSNWKEHQKTQGKKRKQKETACSIVQDSNLNCDHNTAIDNITTDITMDDNVSDDNDCRIVDG